MNANETRKAASRNLRAARLLAGSRFPTSYMVADLETQIAADNSWARAGSVAEATNETARAYLDDARDTIARG